MRSERYLIWSAARVAVAVGLAGLGVTAAQAVTYKGSVAVGFLSAGMTTDMPASYSISKYGSTATTTTSAERGGTADALSVQSAFADSVIQYTFTLVGAGDVFVPLHVAAYGYADGSGANFESYAQFGLYYHGPVDAPYESFLTTQASSNNLLPRRGEFNLDTWIMVQSNSISSLTLQVQAFSQQSFMTTGGAHAFIDPVFTIDPAFASRFTIEGVPAPAGVPATVPEPTTWALTIVGLGLVGGVSRRRWRRLPA